MWRWYFVSSGFLLLVFLDKSNFCESIFWYLEQDEAFKHFHQGLSQKLKKSALTNDWENVAYWEEWEKCCISGESHKARKGLELSPLFNFEIVFPALKLTRNCYWNMSLSFSWKLAICLETYCVCQQSQWDFKNPNL